MAFADEAERTLEAGRVADSEQLLGVRPRAGPPGLLRRGQVEVEDAVVRRGVAIATSGGGRAGGVDDLFGCLSIRAQHRIDRIVPTRTA